MNHAGEFERQGAEMNPATTHSDSRILSYTFSTAGEEMRDQVDAWDAIMALVSVQSHQPRERGFRGRATAWNLGRLLLARLSAQAMDFQRDARRLRADAIDHWYLCIPLSGIYVREEGAIAAPGHCQVNTLYRTGGGWHTDIDAIFLSIPRDLCPSHAPALDQLHATNLAPGLGGLLVDYLKAVEQRLPTLGPEQLPALVEATRAMVIACAAPDRDTLAEAMPVVQTTQLERAKHFIRHNVLEPHLNVKALSRQLGISRTSLYRLFEPLGGVVHYVRSARLQDAHRLLSTGSDLRPIHEIAAERGFVDPSEFSRAFKRQFGYSPSEARHEGRPVPLRSVNAQPTSASNFGEVLAALA